MFSGLGEPVRADVILKTYDKPGEQHTHAQLGATGLSRNLDYLP